MGDEKKKTRIKWVYTVIFCSNLFLHQIHNLYYTYIPGSAHGARRCATILLWQQLRRGLNKAATRKNPVIHVRAKHLAVLPQPGQAEDEDARPNVFWEVVKLKENGRNPKIKME